MAKTALTVSFRIDGIDATLRRFRGLPKEADKELRDAAGGVVEDLVGRARSAAQADRAPQSRLLAPTVRVKRGRTPAISAGGSKRVGRSRAPAYKVLFGSEFGSNQYPQFERPHRGRQGYWFFPLVESESEMIGKAWLKAADEIVDRFSRGGR